jgi:hypothetical protein
MAQMGISKQELRRKGIKFDSQGSLQSSAEETMRAFERIIYEKYDSAYRKSTTTSEAMAASITDSFQQIQRSMGATLNDGLKPFVAGLGEMMDKVSKSNLPQLFATDLLAPFKLLYDGTEQSKQGLIDFMAVLAALANVLPAMATRIGQNLREIADPQRSPLQRLDAMVRVATSLNPSQQAFDVGAQFYKDFERYSKAAQTPAKGGKSAIDESQRLKPFMDVRNQMPEDKEHKKSVTHHLQRIASNTRRSADLLDLRNQTLGGGRLGALGITGAEISAAGGRVHTDLSKAKPISGDSMITRGIRQMISNNLGFAVNGGRSLPIRN